MVRITIAPPACWEARKSGRNPRVQKGGVDLVVASHLTPQSTDSSTPSSLFLTTTRWSLLLPHQRSFTDHGFPLSPATRSLLLRLFSSSLLRSIDQALARRLHLLCLLPQGRCLGCSVAPSHWSRPAGVSRVRLWCLFACSYSFLWSFVCVWWLVMFRFVLLF